VNFVFIYNFYLKVFSSKCLVSYVHFLCEIHAEMHFGLCVKCPLLLSDLN
jgi:hypothetical protein